MIMLSIMALPRSLEIILRQRLTCPETDPALTDVGC